MLSFSSLLITAVFVLGYLAIILEYTLKINKAAVAMLIAVACWTIYLVSSIAPARADIAALRHHVSEVSQIIFFLMGAMTLVELIDSHRGFKLLTDRIRTYSRRRMLWIVAIMAFFLSAVLDNLTTTILMVSLLRKMVPERKERLLYSCLVVVAANAGGAWTPIGDVTTTMLWINGQISSISVIRALFIPSMISLLIPLLWYSWQTRGRFPKGSCEVENNPVEPGAFPVLCLGVGGLIFVPIFKAMTGLPPFMGVILALSLLWILTDLMHFKYAGREHLRVPHVLTRVDTSGVLFFLGILLCVDALQTAGILQYLAEGLNAVFKTQALIATMIGFLSAVVDNVPLVAAAMGMYPLESYPMDSAFWHMVAYAAGTGGSMLIVGSSSGVAMMGMEKIDFATYARKMTLPTVAGYLGGMGVYLLLRPFLS